MTEIAFIPTQRDVPVKNVLGAQPAHQCEVVLVVGFKPDGSVYFATSTGDVADVNLLIDCAKQIVVEQVCAG